jgi:hypothetical protein
MLARCSLSGADRYRCCLNLRSNSYVCAFENRTLLLRFLVLPGCAVAWLPASCCPSDSWSSSSVSSRWSSLSCPMSGALMMADCSVLEESGPGPLEGLPRRGGKLSRETELEWRSGSCSGPPLAGSGGAIELGEVLSGLTCCCCDPETWRFLDLSHFFFVNLRSRCGLEIRQRNKSCYCLRCAARAVVEALRYKSEGRRFDSRWDCWNFSMTSFRPHYGPGVDSASNRNEYQEYFLESKRGRCVGLTTLPPSCADCLDIWQPQPPGTLRAC